MMTVPATRVFVNCSVTAAGALNFEKVVPPSKDTSPLTVSVVWFTCDAPAAGRANDWAVSPSTSTCRNTRPLTDLIGALLRCATRGQVFDPPALRSTPEG